MKQRWLRYIRNFFGFTQAEARGFSVMALILFVLYVAWLVYQLMPSEPYQPLADKQKLDSLFSLLNKADSVSAPFRQASYNSDPKPAPAYFKFDPNKASFDSLLMLGIPAYLAKRLINYRQKGGRFRKKEDMRKLYGLSEELYQELEPWVNIPENNQAARQFGANEASKEYKEKPAAKTPEIFDLNKADSLQLLSVRGIGPVLSGRILKFRNALGGFVTKEQVKEVWGISPEAVEALLQRTSLEAPSIRHIPVNRADVSQLDSHPYISRKQAEWIVAYRTQHGQFQQPEDLLKIHLLDKSFVDKIAPYLTF